MLFLRTFGGLSLENSERSVIGAAGQPRRLAVLAVLAVADDAGFGRDRLCALFWPDSDPERARRALNQALHALRRDVGEQDLVLGTALLRLNSAAIMTDVAAFNSALSKGDPAAAVAHYTGPFLDGVHLRGESEFERWADDNRRVLAMRYVDALETLTVAATARRDTADAVHWARRLNAADAFNTRAALLLIHAFDAAGDRAAAIKQGESHATLLRNELGVEPSVELTQTLARLRASPPSTRHVQSAPGGNGTLVADQRRSRPASIEVAPLETLAPPAWRRQRAFIAAAALAVGAIAFMVWRTETRTNAPGLANDERLLVVPLASESGRGSDSLGEIATSLLAAALADAPHLRLVDPRAVSTAATGGITSNEDAAQVAAQLGAGRFVRGVIVLEGAHVSMRATLYNSRDPAVSLFSVKADGSADSLFTVTNRLAAEFLAMQYPMGRRRLVQAVARSTRSLDAFKAYLVGDDAMHEARYAEAVTAYQRAVAIDTMFALAWYQLSIAADWAPTYAVIRDAADRAVRTSGHLDEHERLLVAALRAWRYDDFDAAERLYRNVTANWGDDADAHYQLAEVLFHSNPLRGRSFLESEPEFVQVLATDPENEETRLHLARIAAWLGDGRRADSLLSPIIAARPDSQSLELRAFRAAAMRNRAEFSRIVSEFEHRDDGVIYTACTRIAVWARDIDGAERLCGILTSPLRSPVSRAAGHLHLAELAMARGDRMRARLELAQVPDVGRARSLALGAWIETLPGITVDLQAVSAVHGKLTQLDTAAAEAAQALYPWLIREQGSQRHYYLALLDRALGNRAAATRETEAIGQPAAASVDTLKRNYFVSLSARAALEDGRMADALALSGAHSVIVAGDELSSVANRFVRATALAATGHRQDALDAYSSFDGAYIFDLVLAAPAHLRRAEIFEHERRFADARREYDAALALWRHPGPELQSVWQTARQRRAALEGDRRMPAR